MRLDAPRRRRTSGQALVETALATPLLLALLLLALAGGRMISASIDITGAARAAAGAAAHDAYLGMSLAQQTSDAQLAAAQEMGLSGTCDGVSNACLVALAPPAAGAAGGHVEQVTLSEPVDTWLPMLPQARVSTQAMAGTP